MASFSDKFNFPSGVMLPFVLRKRVGEQKAKIALDPELAKKEESTTFLTAANVPIVSPEVAEKEDLQNRTFTSEGLENKLWRTSVALVEIQKQIHRGEETYYEETAMHGNLFRGWEGYLDAKDVGTPSNSKPPKDTRWFSGSSSISRTSRPPAINTQWSHQPRSANTPVAAKPAQTPTPVPQAVAQAPVVPQSTVTPTLPRTSVPAASTPAAAPVVNPPKASKPVLPLPTATTTATPPPAAPAPAPKPIAPTAAAASTTSASLKPAPVPAPAPPVAKPAVDNKPATTKEPVAAAPKPADSFRIPKKKKKNDTTAAPAAAAPAAAKSPTEATAEKASSEPAATTTKKTKGRKRKGFE